MGQSLTLTLRLRQISQALRRDRAYGASSDGLRVEAEAVGGIV